MEKEKIIRITTVSGSFVNLLKGQLKNLSDTYEMIGVTSPGKHIDSITEYEKVQFIPLEMSRRITPIKDLMAIIKLFFILKKLKPKIVHTHTPKAGLVGISAAWLANVPIRIHTIAGLPLLEIEGVKQNILLLVEKVTYKLATKIYPNSFGIKNIILEKKLTDSSKLKVLGNGSSNGIDTSFFNPENYDDKDNDLLKRGLGVSKNDFVYLYVGRIVADKGINELVKAFDELCHEKDNISLVLVGSYEENLDPLKQDTKELIKTNSKIFTPGYKKDVRPYFAMANVFTFPSYREGFPNVVLQASSMNLLSIVTNINGCNEIIDPKRNGYIIEPKDKDGLKEAMLEVYLNFKNKDLIMNERKYIQQNFEREYFWKILRAEYKDLIKSE